MSSHHKSALQTHTPRALIELPFGVDPRTVTPPFMPISFSRGQHGAFRFVQSFFHLTRALSHSWMTCTSLVLPSALLFNPRLRLQGSLVFRPLSCGPFARTGDSFERRCNWLRIKWTQQHECGVAHQSQHSARSGPELVCKSDLS